MKKTAAFIFLLGISLFRNSLLWGQETRLHSFQEILAFAQKHSLTSQRFQDEQWAAIRSALARKGIFDTQLNLLTDYSDEKTPTSSPFASTGNKTISGELALEKRLPYGTMIGLQHGLEKNKFMFPTSGNINSRDSYLGGELRFNLWKNIFGTQDQALLAEIATREKIEKLDAQSKSENYLFSAGEAVLLILTQQDQVENQQRRCHRLDQLRDLNEKRYRRRLIEKKFLLQAQSEAKSCLSNLGDRQLTLSNLRQALLAQIHPGAEKTALSLSPELAWPKVPTLPQPMNPVNATHPGKTDPEEILKRSDLQVAQLAIVEAEKQYKQKKQQRYPELDLVGQVRLNGQDPTSMGDTYGDIGQGEFPSYYLGLNFSIPLERTRGKNESQAAYHNLRVKRSSFQELKIILTKDLENTLDALKTREHVWKQYEEVVKSQTERVKIMQKDYELGRIDTQELIQAEADLTDSLDDRAREKFLFHRAVLNYFLLTGRLNQEFQS